MRGLEGLEGWAGLSLWFVTKPELNWMIELTEDCSTRGNLSYSNVNTLPWKLTYGFRVDIHRVTNYVDLKFCPSFKLPKRCEREVSLPTSLLIGGRGRNAAIFCKACFLTLRSATGCPEHQYTGSVIAVPKRKGHMYIVRTPNESTPSSKQFERKVRREPKSQVQSNREIK